MNDNQKYMDLAELCASNAWRDMISGEYQGTFNKVLARDFAELVTLKKYDRKVWEQFDLDKDEVNTIY